MAKKVTIANSEVIAGSETGIADPFYAALGSWQVKGETLSYNRGKNIPFKMVVKDVEIIETAKTDSILESGYKVELEIQPDDFGQTSRMVEFITLNQRYQDHSAEVVLPDSRADVIRKNRQNQAPASPTVNSDFKYLRENLQYEQTIANVTNEVQLVNYYEPRIINVKNRNSYVKMAKNVLEQDPQERLPFQNIFVPPETIEDMVEANSLLDETSQFSYEIEDLDYTSEIPFLVRLKMKDTNGDIDQKQDFVKLGNNFLFYADDKERDPQGDIGSLLMRWHLQSPNSFIKSKAFSYTSAGAPVRNRSLACYSFLGWLNDFAPARVGDLPQNISALKFFTTDTPSLDLAVDNYEDTVNFSKTLNRFATKFVEDFLNSSSTKRIEDVFAGIPGKTEILYYKVSKFEGNTTTGTPLQTFILPNTRETIDYLDTQVLYGKQYTYEISYMVAIHGCEYEYTNLDFREDNTFGLTVNCYPSIKVVEMPAFVGLGATLASPPLSPRIEILPIRRQENKVKVVFYSGYGNEAQTPILLTQQDRANNAQLLQNGFLTADNSLIEFSSVSTVSRFEVYTSTRQPLEDDDYKNFYNSNFASVSTEDDNGRPLADSAAIVLNLKTNKQYYFTFVARNRLGLASNPTSIFKVRYTNQDGISRLEYEEYDFEGLPETRRETKALTKLINIRPIFAQVNPNLEQSKLEDSEGNPLPSKNKEVFLGNTEDNMFGPPGDGKRFKFRFRSKKTNKVFDINVTCVNNKVLTSFNTQSDSISLAPEEVPEMERPPVSNAEFSGTITNPTLNVNSFKNYNILEDQNLTRRIKKIVPIKEEKERERKDPIGRQSGQIRDIFPTDD